jgi:hypothetical protein
VLRGIRDMKPVIAGIKDPTERKLMTDSMSHMIRTAFNLDNGPRRQGAGYGGIVRAKQHNARAVNDRAPQTQQSVYNEIAQRLEKERLGKI